jgi:nucleoside-diphosphate-sugar epimerase
VKKILITGATGFIGTNLINQFSTSGEYQIYATFNRRPSTNHKNVTWIKTDLTNKEQIDNLFKQIDGLDLLIQAAASSSGIMDTVNRSDFHVTDNVVMNSLLLRAANEMKVKHFIFFSCTNMLQNSFDPQDELSFDGNIGPVEKYFGVGWTKVYIEKLCEFYSKIGETKFTVIRHSNVYGPWDRYKLENAHVCGATITKVLNSTKSVEIWGTGEEKRDLLYIDDLLELIETIFKNQSDKFDLINAGGNSFISISELTALAIELARKNVEITYNHKKPTINFSVVLNNEKAKQKYGWTPKTDLRDGLSKTLDFWKKHYKI